MESKEVKDQKAAVDLVTLEHEEASYDFKPPQKYHLNRYLSKVAATKNMLGAAEALVRDCATESALERIVELAKKRPAVWQAFSNALLEDSGIMDEVSVGKKSARPAAH